MAAGDMGFDINDAALRLDATSERQAEDVLEATFSFGQKGGGKGDGGVKVVCGACGKSGHTTVDCRGGMPMGKGKGGKGAKTQVVHTPSPQLSFARVSCQPPTFLSHRLCATTAAA
jgi:hypothetical protein